MSTPNGTRFVFVDTEATGLDHARHELTEIAWIVRFEDGTQAERVYVPEHTLDGAEPDALRLTHYDQRLADAPRTPMSEWLGQFLEDATDAVLVGAVPDFDARHLDQACRKLGVEPTWDHHLLDVETLALPLIAPGPEAPRSLARTCAALDVEHDPDRAHGALYDARQAMAVFDRVWEVLGHLREEQAPLPPAVPRGRSGEDETDDAADADPAHDTDDTSPSHGDDPTQGAGADAGVQRHGRSPVAADRLDQLPPPSADERATPGGPEERSRRGPQPPPPPPAT